MAKRDYYEVLGVSRSASQDEIKKAYRQAALKYHPDRNAGSKEHEELFKEATEAYQVLSSPENRSRYDQYGHAAFDANGGFQGFGDFGAFAEDLFGDLFGAFFGGAGGGRRSQRRQGGRDLRFQLEISLEEAAFGTEKEVTIQRPIACADCSGSGSRKGTGPETCRQCGGSGQLRISQGFFTISRPCAACGGRGQTISDPCPKCNGSGRVAKDATVSIKIPAGINDGQSLRLRGEGEPAAGSGPAGDLYVEIGIAPHRMFRRQDTEVLSEIPVSYAQAALGADIEVPTLEGKVALKIPAGTQSGTTFRLRGKGIVDMHTGRRGDQHVRAIIVVPKNLSARQKELLQELAAIEGNPSSDEDRTLFERVKEFFE